MKTGGNNGYDAELSIGATIDGGQLQKDLEKVFSNLHVSGPMAKKAGDLGKGFLDNAFSGDGVRRLNERIATVSTSLRKLDSLVDEAQKRGAEGKATDLSGFLKPFDRLVSGLSTDADKMSAVRRHLMKEKNELQKVVDSFQSLANNAPKTSRKLEAFSALPDEKRIKVNERNLKEMSNQLAAEKKLLEDMRNLQKAAREAGLKGVAAELGGRLPAQAAKVRGYESALNLPAAQERERKRLEKQIRDDAQAVAKARQDASNQRIKDAQKNAEKEAQAEKKAAELDQKAIADKADAIIKAEQQARARIAAEKALGRKFSVERAAFQGADVGGVRNKELSVENLKHRAEQLRLGVAWQTKMVDLQNKLVQSEEAQGKNASELLRVLGQEQYTLARIKKEHQDVNELYAARVKAANSVSDAESRAAVRGRGTDLRYSAGRDVVGSRGGPGAFSSVGLNLEQAKQASQYLNRLVTLAEQYRNKLHLAGADTKKADERLKALARSANEAAAAVNKLQKEAGDRSGMQRFGMELGSTIKNFAKFALIYQGLYAVLGYVKSLAGAVYDLNTQLANMQAITAESTRSMQGISTAILDTATNSRFSVAEMAEAAKVIAQAGKSAEELPKVLKAVSDFASGTDTNLATSADIITSIGEVYKDLSDADIANQLTKAVNISKLNGEDLKTILSLGAQVGEGYNITSEQMLSAASVLRNAGIKASTVATGLRQAMVEVFNLQDNSVKALQEQYAKIGQDLTGGQIKAKFFNFSKEADPLLAVLRELKTLGFGAGGDFTLGRAFDIRALNVLKALTANTQDYLKLQKEITFGQPAAEAAATSMNSLSAQLTRFNNILTAMFAQDADGFFKKFADGMKTINDYMDKRRIMKAEEEAAAGVSTNPEQTFGQKVRGAAGVVGQTLLESTGILGYGYGKYLEKTQAKSTVSDETAQAQGLVALDAANVKLEELRSKLDAFDPTVKEGGMGKFIATYEETLTKFADSMSSTFEGTDTDIKKLASLIEAFGNETDRGKRQAILAELQQSVANGEQLDENDIKEISNQIEEIKATSAAAVDNFKAFYTNLQEVALKGGEAGALATEQIKILTSPENIEKLQQMLRGGFGEDRASANVKAIAELTGAVSVSTRKAVTDQMAAMGDLMAQQYANELAIAAALPDGQAEAAVEHVTNKYMASLAAMGSEAASSIFDKLRNVAVTGLSEGGFLSKIFSATGSGSASKVAANLNLSLIPKSGGQGKGIFPAATGEDKFAEAKRLQLEAEAKVKADKAQLEADLRKPVEAKLSKQEFVADPSVTARANEIDFEITKLQKFGDATGRAADLINEKNGLLAAEKNREIANAQYNLKVAEQHGKKSEEYQKAAADLADKQLDLQKVELQSKEEYLDNMQKSAVKEMGMYDQQKASILAAGDGFEGLAELNSQYLSTQQKLISEMEDYMRNTLNMTEEEIQKYIESRPELKKGLLADKDISGVTKKYDAATKAAEAAIPKTATTGDPLMDAKARAGLGFTNAEKARFAGSKYSGIQNQIAVSQDQISGLQALLPAANEAQKDQLTAMIEERTASIRDMNTEIDDLAAEIEDFSSTAASELASVFNEEGIRKFTTALESSGNALKDWGDNIRDSLLTAWDSVGDAIAGAVLEGEDFVESMKKIARDLAKEVFTMTTKNMMNNVLLGAMTGSYGGIVPGQPTAGAPGSPTTPATPAAGGFVSTVASALGIQAPGAAPGAAGTAVSTMTVNAGSVTVNGAAAGLPGGTSAITEKAKELVGPPAPDKSLFQVVEDKISAGMDNVMGSLEKAFKGLDAGLGGLLSGIGNMASDMWNGAGDALGSAAKWVGGMFASTGAIIPAKFAGGYVSKSGMIKGPGSGTSDSIRGFMYTKSGRAPIAVSSGESILTAKATSMLGENTIKSLNAGTARKFSTGGMVAQSRSNADAASLKTPSPSVTVNPAAPQSIQMINTIDSDSVVQAGLSSPGSVKTLMNVIKANKTAFKQVLT